jgi:signal transduction histidine kinase
VFDASSTTYPEGMRLGLTISGTNIEAHGGRLRVTPSDDHGATVQCILPMGSILGSEISPI